MTKIPSQPTNRESRRHYRLRKITQYFECLGPMSFSVRSRPTSHNEAPPPHRLRIQKPRLYTLDQLLR